MFGADRRKTFGSKSIASSGTPSKMRLTDVGMASIVKKSHSERLSLNQSSGQPRLSLFQRSSAVAPRDVKSLISVNVSKIYQFLLEHEGENAPPERTIRSPKGRSEFMAVFDLIYQHLNTEYEISSSCKLEDEIPSIFKGLGYPYPIKNSYFNPMGSSHGYPHLLDAIAWLVDTVKMSLCIRNNPSSVLFSDFLEQDVVAHKATSYSWLCSTYREYTNDRHSLNNPDYLRESESRIRNFFNQEDSTQESITALKGLVEQLNTECLDIESDKGTEEQQKDEIVKVRNDIRKAGEYAMACENFMKNVERDLRHVEGEMQEKMSELGKIQEQIAHIEERIEEQKQTHGLSGEAVRRMNLENTRGKDILRDKQSQMSDLSKESWVLVRKSEEEFMERKSQYNQLLQTVNRLINGLEIQFESFVDPKDEEEMDAEISRIMSILFSDISDCLNKKKIELDALKSKISQTGQIIHERVEIENEKLEEVKRKEGREERNRRKEREEWKEERAELEKKIDERMNQLEVLEGNLQTVSHLEKQIANENENFEMTKAHLIEKKEHLESAIKEKLDSMTSELLLIENERLLVSKLCNELDDKVSKLSF